MSFLIVLGKIDLINRIIHTQKLVNILLKIYPQVTIIVEDISPVLKSYFNEEIIEYLQAKYIEINKPFLQKIRLSIIHDLLVSLAIVTTLRKIVRSQSNSDRIIFVKGFNVPLALLLKLLKYKIVQFAGGFGSATLKGVRKYWLLFKELLLVKMIDLLILETPSVFTYYSFLKRFERKIFPYGALYVDNRFKVTKSLEKREFIIGYVGALTLQKGVAQLFSAISFIKRPDVKLFIIGDGPLKDQLKTKIRNLSLEDRVLLLGSVPYCHLHHYLNEMRLLVLPSLYGEGLPNVILEAMACGTPVLATPVGGIPDVIRDDETGFILTSTEPFKIAKKINEILIKDDKELQKIVNNALKLINTNYRLESAVKRYKLALKNLEITGGR
jgi:glycosyltransferase involved in cell wall biosynthesis